MGFNPLKQPNNSIKPPRGNSLVDRAKGAIETVKKVVSKIIKIIHKTIVGIIKFISFNFSTVGLIMWAVILLFWFVYSFGLVVGTLHFDKKCLDYSFTIKESEDECVTMGSGKNFSRLHINGGARERKSRGLVDTSSLLAYLESVYEEDKSNLIVNNEKTNNWILNLNLSKPLETMEDEHPQMLEAKDIAYENSNDEDLSYEGVEIIASCDRAVATTLRALEIDTEFPWGATTQQKKHMLNNPSDYQMVWKEGDGEPNLTEEAYIVFWENAATGKGEHIAIIHKFEGSWRVYQASYGDYLPHKGSWYRDLKGGSEDLWDGTTMSYWSFPHGTISSGDEDE